MKTPTCRKRCDLSSLNYENELTFGKVSYRISNREDQIKFEIMKNGPVEADFDVYEDFYYYKSGMVLFAFIL